MNNVNLTINTYGFEGLEKTFNNFQYKDKRNIIIAAFRKATAPTVSMTKQNIHNSVTGNLYKSIGVVPMDTKAGVWVGARITRGYRGFHGHLVEDGTVERFYMTKKGKRHDTGKMNPNGPYAHFFKKAIDATEDKAVKVLAEEWHKAIARFIVRSNKKDK